MTQKTVSLDLIPLTSTDISLIGNQLKNFDCHDGIINKFLQEEAFEAQQTGQASTVLLVDSKNNNKIFGFFATHLKSIDIKDEEEHIKETYTAINISVFAIDAKYQRKGIGTSMMEQLLLQLITFNEMVGFQAVFLGAIAKYYKFYEKSGFVLFNHFDGEITDKDQEVDMILKLDKLYNMID